MKYAQVVITIPLPDDATQEHANGAAQVVREVAEETVGFRDTQVLGARLVRNPYVCPAIVAFDQGHEGAPEDEDENAQERYSRERFLEHLKGRDPHDPYSPEA